MFKVCDVYKATMPMPKVEWEGSKFKLPVPRGQTLQTKHALPKEACKDDEEEPKVKYGYEDEPEKRIDMLRRVHIQEWWDGGVLDPSWCACPDCEYSSGDLMGQRYSLMRRLYQVNSALYGRNKNKHIGEVELLRTLI